MTRAGVLLVTALGVAFAAEARQSPDAIARAIVIGQAYVSGNVYVAGFVEDEPRPWPRRITARPLREAPTQVAADFFRTVTQDSDEHYWFAQSQGGEPPALDVFSTVDRAAVSDRNLARYRASADINESLAIVGWDERLQLTDISWRDNGRPRPTTARERREVEADRKSIPKDAGCTTVPQFLDDAKVILTATVSGSNLTIRLSQYSTPGCAGHLSDIYLLDVIVPGQEPRRFEFRHYQGVI